MANTKSSKKSIRQTIVRTARNRHIKSTLRTLGKNYQLAVQSGDAQKATAAAQAFASAVDKAAKRGIIHLNKAARHKSAIAKHAMAAA